MTKAKLSETMFTKTKKQTPWLFVRKRTISTERPPLVGEVSANFLRIESVAWSAQRIPKAVKLGFPDRSRYFSIQVAPQLSSRGWEDPVPDTLLLRKSGSAGNGTRDLWICSQEFWSLDHSRLKILFLVCQYFELIKKTCTYVCFRINWFTNYHEENFLRHSSSDVCGDNSEIAW
jgi:hypothetical protein